MKPRERYYNSINPNRPAPIKEWFYNLQNISIIFSEDMKALFRSHFSKQLLENKKPLYKIYTYHSVINARIRASKILKYHGDKWLDEKLEEHKSPYMRAREFMYKCNIQLRKIALHIPKPVIEDDQKFY